MKKLFVLSLLLMSFIVTGCGGGGGSSSSADATNITGSDSDQEITEPADVTGPDATDEAGDSGDNEDVEEPSDPAEDVPALPEYTEIPDENFETALISLGIDDVIDGQVLTDSVLEVTSLYISGRYEDAPGIYEGDYFYYTGADYIQDVTGIENFTNLEHLQIENQQFTSIDVTALTNLTFLSLWENPITELDVSQNTELLLLGISETSLTTIDTSTLVNLVEADFHQNSEQDVPYTTVNGTVVPGLTSVDFSSNTALIRLYLHSNPLTDLGISVENNIALQEVWAMNTALTTLDLSGFVNVRYIILDSSASLTDLNTYGTDHGTVPYRLYCQDCPSLIEIGVTDVAATLSTIAAVEEWDAGIGTMPSSVVRIDEGIDVVPGL